MGSGLIRTILMTFSDRGFGRGVLSPLGSLPTRHLVVARQPVSIESRGSRPINSSVTYRPASRRIHRDGYGSARCRSRRTAYYSELRPRRTFGLLATVQAAGNLIALTVAGLLWSTVSPQAAFVFLAAAMGHRGGAHVTAGRDSGPAGRWFSALLE